MYHNKNTIMNKNKFSRRKKRISKLHSTIDAIQFVPLLGNLIVHRKVFDPQLAQKAVEELTRDDFEILAFAVTDHLCTNVVGDFLDLDCGTGLYLITAWTARVEFRFDHSQIDNRPLRQDWVSGVTLHRAWEFAQLSDEDRQEAEYRCKTLLLDLLLLLHGWEGYAGFLHGWRLENTTHCLPLPEDFK